MSETIYQFLDRAGVTYTEYTHPAVFTAQEALEHYKDHSVWKSKNLFLRNRKGDQHYLLVVDGSARVDLKSIANFLNEKQVSFASPERLFEHLQVTPGSVSPLALIHDPEHKVKVLVDSTMQTYDRVYHHPNINTATLEMSRVDFEKFLEATGHGFQWITVS